MGVAEDGPEVEAIDSPKKRKEKEPQLEEPSGVSGRFFLRQAERSVDGGPARPSRRRREGIRGVVVVVVDLVGGYVAVGARKYRFC